jgi:outer membrane protein assembly factor BamA
MLSRVNASCCLGSLPFHTRHLLLAGLLTAALLASGRFEAAQARPGETGRDTTITAWTILPVVFHTPETGTGGGVAGAYHYKHHVDDRPSSISWITFYTEKKQTILLLNPEIYLSGGSRRLLLELGYEDYPNVFYGVGSGTLTDHEEDYREKSFDLEVSYEVELRRNLRLGPRLDFRRSHIIETEAGGLLAEGGIRGVEKYRSLLLGLVLIYDGRDNILYTTHGSYLSVSTNYAGDATGSDHEYSRHSFDLRHFIGLGGSHAIGLRARFAAAGGSPPFQSLPGLGGEGLMRGFTGGRFRDKLAYTGQAEYRLKLPWRLGFAAFAALGDVAGAIDDFTGSGIKFSGGTGIRFRLNNEGLNLRLDMGFTEEGSGFYFIAGEAF